MFNLGDPFYDVAQHPDAELSPSVSATEVRGIPYQTLLVCHPVNRAGQFPGFKESCQTLFQSYPRIKFRGMYKRVDYK